MGMTLTELLVLDVFLKGTVRNLFSSVVVLTTFFPSTDLWDDKSSKKEEIRIFTLLMTIIVTMFTPKIKSNINNNCRR